MPCKRKTSHTLCQAVCALAAGYLPSGEFQFLIAHFGCSMPRRSFLTKTTKARLQQTGRKTHINLAMRQGSTPNLLLWCSICRSPEKEDLQIERILALGIGTRKADTVCYKEDEQGIYSYNAENKNLTRFYDKLKL